MLDSAAFKSLVQNRNRVLFYLKLIVSIGLIVYLLWAIDWGRAINTINQSNKLLIAISPLFWLFSLVAGSFRWRLVLAGSNVAFSFRQAYTGYLLGSFYNIFLPGVVGGDAIRVGLCVSQTQCKVGTATASVLLERVSGVLSLLSFFLFVSIRYPETISSLITIDSTAPLVLAVAFGIALMALILLARRTWTGWLPREASGRLWMFLRSGFQVLETLSGRTLGLVFLLSVALQGVRIGGMFVLSQGLGLDLPLRVFFATIPLVYLVTLLPISLGGLGVREGTLAFLLAQFGVSTSDAIMLSFLIYLNQALLGILGGLVQLIRTLSGRRAANVTDSANTAGIAHH